MKAKDGLETAVYLTMVGLGMMVAGFGSLLVCAIVYSWQGGGAL